MKSLLLIGFLLAAPASGQDCPVDSVANGRAEAEIEALYVQNDALLDQAVGDGLDAAGRARTQAAADSAAGTLSYWHGGYYGGPGDHVRSLCFVERLRTLIRERLDLELRVVTGFGMCCMGDCVPSWREVYVTAYNEAASEMRQAQLSEAGDVYGYVWTYVSGTLEGEASKACECD